MKALWKLKSLRIRPLGKFNSPRGFTLIELLVAVGVLGIFFGAIFFVYQRTMASFQASSWKQDKASQGERFWQFLRKHFEEASNKNWVSDSGTDFTVETRARPLLYRSIAVDDPESAKQGRVMAWSRSHLDSSGNLAYQLYCILTLDKRALRLTVTPYSGSPDPPVGETIDQVVLEDVDGFVVKTTPIRQSRDKGDYLTSSYAGSTADPIVGTLAEISIILNPPPNASIRKIPVNLNNKFKLGVDATAKSLSDTNFSYPPTD